MPEMVAAWTGGASLGLLIVTLWMVAMTLRYLKGLEAKVDVLLKHSGADIVPPDRDAK